MIKVILYSVKIVKKPIRKHQCTQNKINRGFLAEGTLKILVKTLVSFNVFNLNGLT